MKQALPKEDFERRKKRLFDILVWVAIIILMFAIWQIYKIKNTDYCTICEEEFNKVCNNPLFHSNPVNGDNKQIKLEGVETNDIWDT